MSEGGQNYLIPSHSQEEMFNLKIFLRVKINDYFMQSKIFLASFQVR